MNINERRRVITAKTQAKNIFVSWVIGPNRDACDMSQVRNYFKNNYDDDDLRAWKIVDVMVRREPNSHTNQVGNKWPRHVFVTMGQEEEGADDIGRHLAAIFTRLVKMWNLCWPKMEICYIILIGH